MYSEMFTIPVSVPKIQVVTNTPSMVRGDSDQEKHHNVICQKQVPHRDTEGGADKQLGYICKASKGTGIVLCNITEKTLETYGNLHNRRSYRQD